MELLPLPQDGAPMVCCYNTFTMSSTFVSPEGKVHHWPGGPWQCKENAIGLLDEKTYETAEALFKVHQELYGHKPSAITSNLRGRAVCGRHFIAIEHQLEDHS